MPRNTRTRYWLQLLFFIALLLPWVLLLLGSGGGMHSMLWFWMILLILASLIFAVAAPPDELPIEEAAGPRMLRDEEQPPVVRELMDVRIALEQAGVRSFRGPLHSSPETTFEKLKAAASDEWVPLLQEDEQLGAAIILMPRSVEQQTLERRARPWMNWTLFGLTFLTTTWAGAAHQG